MQRHEMHNGGGRGGGGGRGRGGGRGNSGGRGKSGGRSNSAGRGKSGGRGGKRGWVPGGQYLGGSKKYNRKGIDPPWYRAGSTSDRADRAGSVGMLPPPGINAADVEKISKSYDKFYATTFITGTANGSWTFPASWAYESFCDGRTANAFYVETVQSNKEKQDRYVAYVPVQSWLSMPMAELKEATTRGLGTGNAPFGYLYYSATRSYQQDGKTASGFMTFLIPFQFDAERQIAHDLQAPGDACAVRTIPMIQAGQSAYPEGGNCPSLQVFLGFFGQYLWTTNIPMLKEGVTMHSNDVDSLAKTLVKLCDSAVKRVLKRSDKSLYIAGYGCNALVHKKEDFVDATEGSNVQPWNVTVEMVLPYTNDNNYYKVSNIVQCVMNACFQRVAKPEYQGSMLVMLQRGPDTANNKWTAQDTKMYYRKLWLTSVWLLVSELCREELTLKRISRLSYSLFSDFMPIYQSENLFPSDAVWKTYQETSANQKGHRPPTNLEHFAGVNIAPTIAAIVAKTPDQQEAAALNRSRAESAPRLVIPARRAMSELGSREHTAAAEDGRTRELSVPLDEHTRVIAARDAAQYERDFLIYARKSGDMVSDERLALYVNFREKLNVEPNSKTEMDYFEKFYAVCARYPNNGGELQLYANYVMVFGSYPTLMTQLNGLAIYMRLHSGALPGSLEIYNVWFDAQESSTFDGMDLHADLTPSRDW
jgi:hypothetical protein